MDSLSSFHHALSPAKISRYWQWLVGGASSEEREPVGHTFFKPSGVVLKEVGAPACRIKVALSANALTPWLKDLDASTWAQDLNTRRQALS
jgi:hypothetical protein